MSDLVLIDHLVFLHLLDGDDFTSLAISADAHLAEGTPSNDLQWFEITHCDLCSRHAVEFGLLVLDLLLNEFFFLLT